MRLHVRALEAFNRWFTSAGGVWQTIAFCIAVSAWELLHPGADPAWLRFMVALTIYSGVTQPMIAYVTAKAANNTDEMMDSDCVVDRQTYELVKRIAEKLEID
ncbi:hypothetical protein ACAG26_24430 [Mycobacterium sp. pUA109]|uniref:hypothetical protein n=1 Tax=Mycobacterium sp. pUA109 TaxID=3238982 RepID=UPI00351BA3D8